MKKLAGIMMIITLPILCILYVTVLIICVPFIIIGTVCKEIAFNLKDHFDILNTGQFAKGVLNKAWKLIEDSKKEKP